MKTVILTLGACIATFATFMAAVVVTTHKPTSASEQFGKLVAASLQKPSFEEYSALFPTLEELHNIMEQNVRLYGKQLTEAQHDFANTYTNTLLPALKKSFDQLIHKGRQLGIDWKAIQYMRTEASNNLVYVEFKSHSKTYRVRIERAPMLNGEWRTSQFISLETL